MKLAKKMILAAAVLPLTLGTTAALAYGGHGWDKEGDGHCGDRGERGIWKQLDLTAEQQAQLKEMREAGREEMRANRVKMMEKRHQMMSILTAEQKAKLQTLQQEKMAECMQDGQHGKGKKHANQ
ncbi:Spy/CpxP family protein refolding chaperone [Vibrio cholerae]|uniref:Spy/CpxP family protein refolding chaperone n=1 Tax=Vibrio cholerae TaxID=666 RepID=UPI000E6984FA|nr:Spy/CpxP family protein refolding chaperone [Vibrio cholerae]